MSLYKQVNLATVSTASSATEDDVVTFASETAPSDGSARLILDVTAVVTSVNVTVKAVVGGKNTLLATFAEKTTTGSEHILIEACPKTLEVTHVIVGGTATFTVDLVRF